MNSPKLWLFKVLLLGAALAGSIMAGRFFSNLGIALNMETTPSERAVEKG